jgi:hypothetical protein
MSSAKIFISLLLVLDVVLILTAGAGTRGVILTVCLGQGLMALLKGSTYIFSGGIYFQRLVFIQNLIIGFSYWLLDVRLLLLLMAMNLQRLDFGSPKLQSHGLFKGDIFFIFCLVALGCFGDLPWWLVISPFVLLAFGRTRPADSVPSLLEELKCIQSSGMPMGS